MKYSVTFDKSQQDIPALVVCKEFAGLFSNPSIEMVNIITGSRAEDIFDSLTNKNSESANIVGHISDDGKITILKDHSDFKTDFISDGYHTFAGLYHQRAILFAALVNLFPEISWKTWHDQEGYDWYNLDKEWFLVCIETPAGPYSYHYKRDYWDMFACKEIEKAKDYDGHTEADVSRLLTLKELKDINIACDDKSYTEITKEAADRI